MNTLIKSEKVYTILCIFLFLFFTVSAVSAQTEEAEDEIYVLSGDLVKNFKFDSIDGTEIDSGGSAHNNRLKFESEPLWEIKKDTIELVYTEEKGNETYMYYKLPMYNTFNIYTNTRLSDVCSKMEKKSKNFHAGSFQHYGCFGDIPDDYEDWSRDITLHYWDFGNIRAHNEGNNIFGGTVDMSFDIAPSTLPETFKNEDGTWLKKFDYIGVSSAAVLGSEYDKMSDDEPEFDVRTAKDYSDTEGKADEPDHGDMKAEADCASKDFSGEWDPDVKVENYEEPSDTWDGGIQPPSDDSSLNPTGPDGSKLWDPYADNKNESVESVELHTNIGKISPYVELYKADFSWDTLDIDVTDEWSPKPFACNWDLSASRNPGSETETKPVALHVTNRYIQVEVQVVFNLWSSYEVQTKEPLKDKTGYTGKNENYSIGRPNEYYDKLLWSIVEDGWGGGEQETEAPTGLFDDLFGGLTEETLDKIILIVFLIIGSILFVAIAYYIIKWRRRKKMLEGMFGRRGPYPQQQMYGMQGGGFPAMPPGKPQYYQQQGSQEGQQERKDDEGSSYPTRRPI